MSSSNQSDCEATPAGLMRCLIMLADEAAVLHLPRTLYALREALNECRSEMQAEQVPAATAVLH